MTYQNDSAPLTRKTRIVCISDTHNQTPKLPKGDVLIHAGDLTNQGSYSELKKTVEWLENANFEAKIVVAGTFHLGQYCFGDSLTRSGNHDLTLDAAFYAEHGSSWKWPKPQDPEKCRKLFEDSPSITYLENEAASVYLNSPNGPHTCFNVFGSPCAPNRRKWAFRYLPEEAERVWNAIPSDADIVVTHTPPLGNLGAALTNDRSGCEVLLEALHRVRPMLSVFGHIHEARGVERVQWNVEPSQNGCLVEGIEPWTDPGKGNNKQSLVNLTSKGGRPLNNSGFVTRQTDFSLVSSALNTGIGGQLDAYEVPQPSNLKSTSRPEDAAHSEARVTAVLGGAIVCRQAAQMSDIGLTQELDVEKVERRKARRETVMINAAFLGPRMGGGPKQLNKPIVVDVDLPIWS